MPAVTGVTFLLAVWDGAAYQNLGGQRSTNLNRDTSEADASSKDAAAWHQGLPTVRQWTFDAGGTWIEGDVAYVDLEDAFTAALQIQVQITTPGGATYTGTATVTELNLEAPHDDVITYSVSLVGSGALVKA